MRAQGFFSNRTTQTTPRGYAPACTRLPSVAVVTVVVGGVGGSSVGLGGRTKEIPVISRVENIDISTCMDQS